jgi:hypothetical protein
MVGEASIDWFTSMLHECNVREKPRLTQRLELRLRKDDIPHISSSRVGGKGSVLARSPPFPPPMVADGRGGAASGYLPGILTSIHTRRWSELGNGYVPTSENRGSASSGQNTPASWICRFFRGRT